jgi:hypothetical protein
MPTGHQLRHQTPSDHPSPTRHKHAHAFLPFIRYQLYCLRRNSRPASDIRASRLDAYGSIAIPIASLGAGMLLATFGARSALEDFALLLAVGAVLMVTNRAIRGIGRPDSWVDGSPEPQATP